MLAPCGGRRTLPGRRTPPRCRSYMSSMYGGTWCWPVGRGVVFRPNTFSRLASRARTSSADGGDRTPGAGLTTTAATGGRRRADCRMARALNTAARWRPSPAGIVRQQQQSTTTITTTTHKITDALSAGCRGKQFLLSVSIPAY